MHERDHTHAATQAAQQSDDVITSAHRHASTLEAPDNPIESGLLMRKADGNGVHDGAEAAVASASQSSGFALPTAIMRKFEASTGADLSSVRLHTGPESAAAASAVGARAYTIGQDIHFGAGQYDPSSPAGEHLLAHEVAHTVQQQGGTPTRQNKLDVSTPMDSAEHEADRAADAMVSGSSARIGGFSPQIAREPSKDPAPDQGAKKPAKDPAIIVNSLGQHYQTLMEAQIAGLDNLLSDYNTKDDPSIEQKALEFAVVAGLSAATGLITGPFVAAAVEAVSVRISAAAASKALEAGEEELQKFLTEYTAKTTAYTTKLQGWIKSGVEAAAKSVIAKTGALEPFRAFYEAQRDALRETKMKAQDAVNASAAEFSGPAGYQMAEGIRDAIDKMDRQALDTQYMTSLSQWSKIASGKINGTLTLTLPKLWPRGGAPVLTSAELGANDSIRNRLQKGASFSKRKLNEFPLPLVINVTTPWRPFAGSQTWMANGGTNGAPASYPTSGTGAYDLYHFATGKEYKNNGKDEVEFDVGVKIGAALLFAAMGELTWGGLPALK